MYGEVTMECPSIPPRILRTRTRVVSGHASERMVYKGSSTELAIEVEEDNGGFLNQEVENEHAGHSKCMQERETSVHCVVVIVIAQMPTIDNLE